MILSRQHNNLANRTQSRKCSHRRRMSDSLPEQRGVASGRRTGPLQQNLLRSGTSPCAQTSASLLIRVSRRCGECGVPLTKEASLTGWVAQNQHFILIREAFRETPHRAAGVFVGSPSLTVTRRFPLPQSRASQGTSGWPSQVNGYLFHLSIGSQVVAKVAYRPLILVHGSGSSHQRTYVPHT